MKEKGLSSYSQQQKVEGLDSIVEQPQTLLSVSTFGFDSTGQLKHDMPCPVCLKRPAKFISGKNRNYFGPCSICEKAGYKIGNILDEPKRKWWQ